MAVKDVKKCFQSVQEEYLEMQRTINLLKKDVKENRITIDQYNQFKEDMAPIEQNYERLSYVMFLLEQPSNKHKKKKEYKQNQKYYEHFKNNGNDFDSTQEENKTILKEIRRAIDEIENN